MKKFFYLKISLGLVVFLVLLAVLTGFYRYYEASSSRAVETTDEAQLREKMLDEFIGAYPLEIEPDGSVVELDIVAAPGEIEIFDGYKTKVWSYNGTVPGPQIRLKLGQTLRVNFFNNLPQETTVHFHGVRVPNAMDGVPGVTQPPIKPGEKFVYEFTPKDPGTFWFHPHVRSSEQVERGLFGTLVVEDPEEPEYSQDVLWVLDDWRLTEDKQVYEQFNTPMDLMHDGRWGNVITVNAKLKETLKVRPGERIRLRLVNASNGRVYRLNFGNLKATAIAVDGMNVRKTFNADGFDLAPGNRLDVDFVIPGEASGKFVISDEFTRQRNVLGEIIVSGRPTTTPDFAFPTNPRVPLWSEATKVKIDKEYVLDARRKIGGGIEWTINGKAYPDYDPFTFEYAKFNTFRFRNDSSRLHPMHLHGQFFKVIARNGVSTEEGFFRDTVLIYPKETVDLALVPLDKGTWVNHCHILEHAEAGMMTAVEVK